MVEERRRARAALHERVVEQSRGSIVRGQVWDQLRQPSALPGAEKVVGPTMPSQVHARVAPICNCKLKGHVAFTAEKKDRKSLKPRCQGVGALPLALTCLSPCHSKGSGHLNARGLG